MSVHGLLLQPVFLFFVFRLISKLQDMSEETRRASALFGAFFITLLVFFVWFIGLRTPFAPDAREQASIAVSRSEEFSPVASLKRSFGELVKGISAGFEKSVGNREQR